ncbi:hypothetical protein GCG21_05560 [Pseudactinotalea sp. HY160]|uniref:hypothetical protein n=1 Tax=Pseudactinotalea sp. HY160 TaxID=2654490 RepID=UPI00128C1F9D|nr:hypothetical protein [Pseudactinotalea sp. HY160]MPV49476.1 hypothetical protein [Pseudactinotalea sp. HY160]
MWILILILAYLAALVFIWRGWGVLARIGCYAGLHLLAAPAWILLIIAAVDGNNDTMQRATRIYLLVVLIAFIVASVLARPRTLERQARYREAMREAVERLGRDMPHGTPFDPPGFGGRVITDPPPPAGPPNGRGSTSPRSPEDGTDA